MIPLSRPDIGPEEMQAVAEALQQGQLVSGHRVTELEQRWAAHLGMKHGIGVANQTLALMAIHAGLGLGSGDEVITVSHTFDATVSAILSTGATPVFVDIEPDTYLIDAKRIEAAITPRTRAISPVHLYGLPADMDMIRAIADRHGLAVVEDVGQADGARFRGRPAGSFGHAATGVYPTDDVATSGAGVITTDDDRLADWVRAYRQSGVGARGQREILGFDFRMTELQAAIGLVRLDRLAASGARRHELARRYDRAFDGWAVRTPVTPTGRTHAFQLYTIDVGPARDAIAADVIAAGIEVAARPGVPVHRQPYIQERALGADLPITDQAAARSLSLPLYGSLTEAEQDDVIAAVRSAVERHATASGSMRTSVAALN
jgi:dTDP-4-amino-4,6-dideoxygalactose transaminase